MNIELFSPMKDECVKCVEHDHQNFSDDVWAEHKKKKKQAREAKQKDKDFAIQCILQVETGSTKFHHNYNIENQDTECYILHDEEGCARRSKMDGFQIIDR